MALYNMPPDTREKEKIVGGIFDFTQMLWIVAGAGAFVIQALILYRFIGFFCVVTGLGFIIAGFFLAIAKKDDLPYPTYLYLKFKFNRKTKYYINAGYSPELEFSGDEEV